MAIDLSKLSDSDLDAITSGNMSKVSDAGLDIITAQQSVPASKPSSSDDAISAMGGDSGSSALASLGVDPSIRNDRTTQAGMAGVAQGSTLGLSDEIGATKDVAQDLLTGKGTGGDIKAKWRAYQKQREADNKQLAAEHPLAFGMGGLMGGLATTPLMGSLGGDAIIGGIGKLSPEAAAFLASSTPEAMQIKNAVQAGTMTAEDAATALKALPQAGNLAKVAGAGIKMAIQGAPAGAIAGAGYSDNNISSPAGLTKDAASGAATGSLLGMGIGAATEAAPILINKLGNSVNSTDYGAQLNQAYKIRKDLSNKQVRNDLSNLPGQYSEDLVNRVLDTRNELGQDISDSLDLATAKGKTVNVDPALDGVKQEIVDKFTQDPALLNTLDPQTKNIIVALGKGGLGDMSPREAHAMVVYLRNLQTKLANSPSPMAYDAIQLGNTAGQAIDQSLKTQVPDYKAAANAWQDFHSKVPELIMSKGMPEDFRNTFYGDLAYPEAKLYTTAENLLEKGQLEGTESSKYRSTFDKLMNNMDDLQKTNPEALDIMTGGDPAGYKQQLQDQADKLATLRQIRGKDPENTPDILTKGYQAVSELFTGSKAPTLGLANTAGRVADFTNQSVPVKTAQRVFNASDEQLNNLAQYLKGTNGLGWYGNALEKALQNKSDFAKKAVLFNLMQQPEYRHMLTSDEDKQDKTPQNQ